MDDELVTEEHPMVEKGIDGIPEIFSSLYTNQEGMKFGYRPVVIMTYALEYSIFSGNPHISHFINVLIYIITALVLFRLLSSILYTLRLLPV